MVEKKKTRTKKTGKKDKASIEFSISESLPPSKADENKLKRLMEEAGETVVDPLDFTKTIIIQCVVQKPIAK
jgi:hypothetical protein